MLDILDFITEKGGDVAKIFQSQMRRNASTDLINEVIELYDEHRKGMNLLCNSDRELIHQKPNIPLPWQDKA